MAITINGTLTLDESAALQTGGVAVGDEDNNDQDVSLSTLQSGAATFYNRLFTGLGLDSSFATANGVAESASDFISVSGSGITDLGFVDGSGAALPVYGGVDPGVATSLSALDGGSIVLFADSVLGDRMVLGVDEDGDIVFAIFMDPAVGLATARVWMVQFEALVNPVDTDDDDPVNLFDSLGVAANSLLEFNFDTLPSGSNLFGIVGDAAAGLVIFGKDIGLNPDGTYISNKTQEIKTSQAGIHDTIGIESQMFDPGDAAYFTFVNNPDPNFTGTELGSTEADDADNILYGSTLEGDSAFIRIAQLQGSVTPSMSIQVFNIDGDPQARDMLAARGTNAAGTNPTITDVRVYDAAGTLIESYSSPVAGNGITITINGSGVATVTGFGENYRIEWDSSEDFDQVLITGVAGKFDVGGFGLSDSTTTSVDIGGSLIFEDDGPSVDLVLDGTAELVVDESTLPTSDSILASALLSTNDADFGTDGPGTDDSVYKLTLSDDNSGLYDTLTGDEVLMTINGDGTLITGSVNAGADEVFTIEIDPDTGEVTLTQSRALINGDPTDPDEADTPLTFANGLVGVERTITDGDGDTASDEVDISSVFKFQDDGPTVPGATQDVLDLTTDDTDITDSDTLLTDNIFPGAPDYGSDGPNATTPIVISLVLSSENADSGLVDTATGKSILFKTVGDDIVGYVDTDGNGSIGAGETTEAIRYSLSADGETVTFSQSRGIYHAIADTQETVNANTVTIERVAIDGDGDVSDSDSFDLGAVTYILDDVPTIGPIPDGLVDFAQNDSVTNSLLGDVNNDPNSSPYTLTSYTTSLTVGGVELHGVLAGDAKSVTYWADTNGDSTYGNTGDTAYYSLVLGNQGGAGNYTFTVLIDPPPTFTEFTFDLLPSGSNLFGVVASGNSALLVIGENPVVNGAGNYTNASDVIHTSQGGTGATIGVNNQMFDPGDGAYFTFINDPDPDFISGIPGGLTATEADNSNNIQYNEDLSGPATQEVASAFLGISQIQGGKAGVSMSIEAFNMPGGPQDGAFLTSLGQNHVDITEVRVLDANGVVVEDSDGSVDAAGISITIGADGVATITGLKANYSVEWDSDDPFDQVLVTGVAGKFDVGRFGSFESHEIPDQLLSFTAQVTDGDGDTATDSWNIGIDGTGIYDDDSVSGVII